MKKILNTMNHALTESQLSELEDIYGNMVITNLKYVNEELYLQLSNINATADLSILAHELINTINFGNFDAVILPIGSPAFMYTLASRNSEICADKLFAHSERVSKEVTNADGTVTKTNVFNHVRFISIMEDIK